MRIAVDARELVGAATGAGRYLAQLAVHWDGLDEAAGHTFVFYAHGEVRVPCSTLAAQSKILPGTGGTRWEQFTLASALRRDRPDVLFAPAYTAPLLSGVPTALAVHDVSFAAHPEWFRPREGARRRFVTRAAARRARVVLHSAFRNRDRDHDCCDILRPTTSVSASRLSTKPTAGSARPKFPVNRSYRPPRPTLAPAPCTKIFSVRPV